MGKRGGGAKAKLDLCLNKNEAGCGEITRSLFVSLSPSLLYPAVLLLLLMPTASLNCSLCFQSAFPPSLFHSEFEGKQSFCVRSTPLSSSFELASLKDILAPILYIKDPHTVLLWAFSKLFMPELWK